jgi:predicted O-methyltransferase YrrM
MDRSINETFIPTRGCNRRRARACRPRRYLFHKRNAQPRLSRRALRPEARDLPRRSALWLAHTLPKGGKLGSLEANTGHVRVAQQHRAWPAQERHRGARRPRAGFAPRACEADASEVWLFFVEADKRNNLPPSKSELHPAHSGSLIVFDNVVRDGAEENLRRPRECNSLLAANPHVMATAV